MSIMDEWVKKMWYTHTHTHTYTHKLICRMEYYSAIKEEILAFITTLIDLEGIMLNEISQRKTNII